jgi:hypothetical protein
MTATQLADVAWNLDDLVGEDGPAGVDRLLEEGAERAAAFHAAYAGKVAELDGPGLARAIAELATLADAIGRAPPTCVAALLTDTADPVNGALVARSRTRDGDRDPAAVLRSRVGRGPRARSPTSSCRPTGSSRRATTCARSAATARTCSARARRRSSRRRAVSDAAWTACSPS